MPIRYERHITRDMLRGEPETLFVFGDNLRRAGLGGQAKEMRGEPNAIGIPTKREPSMHPVAFFQDGDLDAYLDARAHDLYRLVRHLRDGGTIVMPAEGIGTGRARLHQTAPAVWRQLQEDLYALKAAAEPSALPASAGRDAR